MLSLKSDSSLQSKRLLDCAFQHHNKTGRIRLSWLLRVKSIYMVFFLKKIVAKQKRGSFLLYSKKDYFSLSKTKIFVQFKFRNNQSIKRQKSMKYYFNTVSLIVCLIKIFLQFFFFFLPNSTISLQKKITSIF